ncbi:hypothetical protein PV779_41430 [Streptomyces sp. ID01-9D]|nr:hypothetical protein [Streptomyces sp. ID01-9D]
MDKIRLTGRRWRGVPEPYPGPPSRPFPQVRRAPRRARYERDTFRS